MFNFASIDVVVHMSVHSITRFSVLLFTSSHLILSCLVWILFFLSFPFFSLLSYYRAVEFTPFRVSKNEDTSKIYAENCGYSMHKCRGVNHYDHECPRDTYRKKIFEYVNNKELPLNPVSTSGPPGEDLSVSNSTAVAAAQRQWVREVCPPLREKPFQETTFWNDGQMSFPIKRTRKSLYDKKEDWVGDYIDIVSQIGHTHTPTHPHTVRRGGLGSQIDTADSTELFSPLD